MAGRHIHASVTWDTCDSVKGLSPVQPHAINLTNADLFSILTQDTNIDEIRMKMTIVSFEEIYIWKRRLQNDGHFI